MIHAWSGIGLTVMGPFLLAALAVVVWLVVALNVWYRTLPASVRAGLREEDAGPW